MIEHRPEYEVAVWLRQQILDLIAGVKDAGSLWWDDSSANWITKYKIDELNADFRVKLSQLGVMFVREHAPCGVAKHGKLAVHSLISSSNYWRLELQDGRTEAHTVIGGELFIDGTRMAHAEPEASVTTEPCPCRPDKVVEHSIYCYEAWPEKDGTRLGLLVECRRILNYARRRSGSNMPRAAIREQLLRCLILLNEAIVPVSAAEHISRDAPSTA